MPSWSVRFWLMVEEETVATVQMHLCRLRLLHRRHRQLLALVAQPALLVPLALPVLLAPLVLVPLPVLPVLRAQLVLQALPVLVPRLVLRAQLVLPVPLALPALPALQAQVLRLAPRALPVLLALLALPVHRHLPRSIRLGLYSTSSNTWWLVWITPLREALALGLR